MSSEQYMRSKYLYTITSKFKGVEFDGIRDSSIMTIVRDYDILTEQLGPMDDRLKASLFVHVFSAEAREFYLHHYYDGRNKTYDQMRKIMVEHYNSAAKQQALQAEMDALDFTSFKERHELTNDTEVLTRMVDFINKTSTRLPDGFRDVKHRTRYLRQAVKNMPFAELPIAQLSSQGLGYQEFANSLHERILFHKERGGYAGSTH